MRKRGRYYESVACKYLEERGYFILERNFRCSRYEIDIVAMDGDVIVFVEVKGAESEEFIHPLLKVNREKLKRIRKCATEYLTSAKHPFKGCRIEIIAIIGDRIEHVKDDTLF